MGCVSGDSLVQYVNAWSPKIDFTEEGAGDYRVVLTLGGPGGETSTEMKISVEAFDANTTGCSSTGNGIGSLVLPLPFLDLVWLVAAKTDFDCPKSSPMFSMLPASFAALERAPSLTGTEPLSAVSSESISIPLDRSTEHMTSVDLRPSSYKESTVIPMTSGWKPVGIQDGIRIWETALPIRSRSFFYSAPAGMTSPRDSENRVGYVCRDEVQQTYSKNFKHLNMSSHSLRVHRKPGAEILKHGSTVPLSKAEQRERPAAPAPRPQAYVLASNKSTTIPVTACTCLAKLHHYTIDVPDNAKFYGELIIHRSW